MKKLRVIVLTLVVSLFTSLIPLHLASAVPTGTGLSLYYKSDSAAWSVPPTAFTSSTCHTSTGNINFNWGGGGPDGVTWAVQASAADNNWYGVTYGNGMFVAVSVNGTGNQVMTRSGS